MSEALFEPPGRTDDRLLLTIVIAAAVHVMVVLGVRLPPEAPVKSRFSAMEVELVPAAPPSATSAAPTAASDGAEEPPLLPMAPVEKPAVKAAPTPTIAEEKPTPAPMATVASKPTPTPKSRSTSPPPAAVAPTAVERAPHAEPASDTAPALPLPTASQLIARSLAIAATGAGLIEDRTISGQSVSERTLYIKNNTRDLTEMAYAEGVRNRAKRFGELFERDVPSGRVGLDVAVASDGSLAKVVITKSSGIEATDAKAIRIIEKAAPFGALPPEMARKYDVAHIEFTMSIVDDQGFNGGQ